MKNCLGCFVIFVFSFALYGKAQPPTGIDEGQLKWGTEFKGVQVAIAIDQARVSRNMKSIPIALFIKNASGKTLYTNPFMTSALHIFYTSDDQGKISQITNQKNSGLGTVGFIASNMDPISIEQDKITTTRTSFPFIWIEQIKSGLSADIELLDSDGKTSFGKISSPPIDAKTINDFMKAYPLSTSTSPANSSPPSAKSSSP